MDKTLYEIKTHGKAIFPYIVYRGKIPEYIRSYPVHFHKEFEIVYVVQGQGLFSVQTNQYIAKEGDIVIIPPEVLHSIKQLNNNEVEYFNILFDFNLLENKNGYCYEKYFKGIYDHTQILPTYLQKEQELNKLITPHLQNLISKRKEKYSTGELMVKSNLYAILYYLVQHSKNTNDAYLKLENNFSKIKNVLYHVQEHYAETITVDNAAMLINYSASYFSKLFRELTGTSFTQYLKDYRLEIAADKLITTEKTITEISQETGFCNLGYFSRSFYQKFGLTPNQYRKKLV